MQQHKLRPSMCSFTDFTSQTYLTVIRILQDSAYQIARVTAIGKIGVFRNSPWNWNIVPE